MNSETLAINLYDWLKRIWPKQGTCKIIIRDQAGDRVVKTIGYDKENNQIIIEL